MQSVLFIPFLVIIAINGFHQTNGLFLTPYLLSLGIQSWLVGILIGVFQVSNLLMIVPSGVLSDRLKIKHLMMIGILCLMVFYLGLQSAANPLLLIVLFFIGGGGTSIVLTSTTALFYKLLPLNRKAKSLAKLNVGRSLAQGTFNITSVQ